MAEETYQEVADKIKENELEKDEVPEPPPSLERSETVTEENEENETTDELETKPVDKVAMKKKQIACRAKLRDKVTCPKCNKCHYNTNSIKLNYKDFCNKSTTFNEKERCKLYKKRIVHSKKKMFLYKY